VPAEPPALTAPELPPFELDVAPAAPPFALAPPLAGMGAPLESFGGFEQATSAEQNARPATRDITLLIMPRGVSRGDI
jgi:hypothetical protein